MAPGVISQLLISYNVCVYVYVCVCICVCVCVLCVCPCVRAACVRACTQDSWKNGEDYLVLDGCNFSDIIKDMAKDLDIRTSWKVKEV